jgi:hypothetical protein
MIHVDEAPVLVSSPLIFQADLFVCSPLLMTEVVTPSGKGCSYGPPVATEIRSRVQLFCGSEDLLYEVTPCCVIPLGMDEMPGYGPHVDEVVGIY